MEGTRYAITCPVCLWERSVAPETGDVVPMLLRVHFETWHPQGSEQLLTAVLAALARDGAQREATLRRTLDQRARRADDAAAFSQKLA